MLQKIIEKSLRGVSRHSGSIQVEQYDLETFMVLPSEGDFEAGVEVAVFVSRFCVKGVCTNSFA